MPQPRIDQLLQGISLQKRIRDRSVEGTYDEHRERAFRRAFDPNADIETVSCEVSLWCPYSQSRLRVPVRSTECTHLECIDLDSWCSLFPHHRSMRDPIVPCPICRNRIRLSTLQIDRWMERLLAHVSASVKLVVLHREGQFEVGSALVREKREREEFLVDSTQGEDAPHHARIKEEPMSEPRRIPEMPSLPPSTSAGAASGASAAPPASAPNAATGSDDALPIAIFAGLPSGAANGSPRQQRPTSPRQQQHGDEEYAEVGETQVPGSSAGNDAARELFSSGQELAHEDGDIDGDGDLCVVFKTQSGPPGGTATSDVSAAQLLFDLLMALPGWEKWCAFCAAPLAARSHDTCSPLLSASVCARCGAAVCAGGVSFARVFWDAHETAHVCIDMLADGTLLISGALSDRLADFLWQLGMTRAPMGYIWFGAAPALGRFELNFLEGLCAAAASGQSVYNVRPVPQMFWQRRSNNSGGTTTSSSSSFGYHGSAPSSSAGYTRSGSVPFTFSSQLRAPSSAAVFARAW